MLFRSLFVSGLLLAAAGQGPGPGRKEAPAAGLFAVYPALCLHVKYLHCRDFFGKLCKSLFAEKCLKIFLNDFYNMWYHAKMTCRYVVVSCEMPENTEKIPFDFLGNYHYNTEVGRFCGMRGRNITVWKGTMGMRI